MPPGEIMRMLMMVMNMQMFLLFGIVNSVSIKSRNGTFEGIEVGKMRVEIDSFLSQEEATKCITLINEFGLMQISSGASSLRIDEIVAHFMQYGSHENSKNQPSSAKTIDSSPRSGGKKTVYAPQLRNDKWVSTWIAASTRVKDVLDGYFGASHTLTSAYLLKHSFVYTPLTVKYPGVNVTGWAVEPHSDHCTITLDSQRGLHCSSTPIRVFDTAAIVYLNHVRGGSSVFVDIPFGRKGLSNATASVTKGKLIFDTKVADLTKVVLWSSPTIVKTDVGKLFFYDSDIDTLHGMSELKQPGEVRYALVYYFKKNT